MQRALVKLPLPTPKVPEHGCEGEWVGLDEHGRPLVDYPGNDTGDPRPARFLAHALGRARPGAAPLAVWLDLSGAMPLILGIIETRLAPVDVVVDAERVRIEAAHELELRCGSASLVLRRDGEVLVRGAEIVSRASGAQKIRGASVQIN